MSVLQLLIAMLFLKSVPQDMPFDKPLAIKIAFGYWISGVMVLSSTLDPSALMESMTLSLVIVTVFVYVVLRVLNLQARFIQTFSAVTGVGLLFNLASWPMLAVVGDDSQSASMMTMMSFVFLMLISWEVLVKAHIFKHALETGMLNALLLSFAMFFIAMTLTQLLFPTEVSG